MKIKYFKWILLGMGICGLALNFLLEKEHILFGRTASISIIVIGNFIILLITNDWSRFKDKQEV